MANTITTPLSRKQIAAALRQLIIDKCAMPLGLSIQDIPAKQHCATYKHMEDLCLARVIFKGQISKRCKARYFDTSARADAWRLAALLSKPAPAVRLNGRSSPTGPRVEAVIVWPDDIEIKRYPTPTPKNTTYYSPLVRTGMRAMTA